MERQQKEMDDTSDRHYDLMNSGGSSGYESYGSTTGGVGLARMASLNNNNSHANGIAARNTPTLLNREVRKYSFVQQNRILGLG